MSDKTSDILEILDKFEFFYGQRAGRELWFNKPAAVQNKDIEDFKRDIRKIREYVLGNQELKKRIVEKLDIERKKPETCIYQFEAYNKAIEIVKEEM